MNIILLHYYLRAGILVKDTAILDMSSYTPCKCRRGGPQLEPQNYYNSVVLAWNLGTFCQARNASLTICSTRTLEKGWGVHSHHVSVGGAVLAP